MIDSPDSEYQDPAATGSLSRILKMWLAMVELGSEKVPYQLVFTIRCASESRANRVAGFLRRRLGCGIHAVKQVQGHDGDEWHVSGATELEIQSLGGLERLSTWLRRTASSHQVRLIHIGLMEATVLTKG